MMLAIHYLTTHLTIWRHRKLENVLPLNAGASMTWPLPLHTRKAIPMLPSTRRRRRPFEPLAKQLQQNLRLGKCQSVARHEQLTGSLESGAEATGFEVADWRPAGRAGGI